MHVSNLTSSRSGNPVANQFEITDGERVYFQSYKTTIASKFGAHIQVNKDFNYSRTTSKYFFQWLRDNAYGLAYESAAINKWLRSAKFGESKEFGAYVIEYVEELN